MSIVVLVIIARNRKKPRYPSTDKWITKIWQIYTMKNYPAVWKNEISKFIGKWGKLETIVPKIRKKKGMFSLRCAF